MPQYHLYQTDDAGKFISGCTFLLPDDETAIAKARELCKGCKVEIWKDMLKLAAISDEHLPQASNSREAVALDSP